MRLIDAIKHCEEKAEELRELSQNPYIEIGGKLYESDGCDTCAKEHEQLASWLRELKTYKENNVKELERVKAKIELMDFDFGDYYDHTDTIIEMVSKVIDNHIEELKGENK